MKLIAPSTGARRLSVVEAVALVPCLSFLVSSFVALVLAEVGAFSLPLLLVLVGVISLVLWLVRPRGLPSLERGKGWWVEAALVGILVVVCAVLYFRPHEYIFGGWDPSTYVATGASIEATGGILYRDEAFAALPPDVQRALVHHRQGLDQRFPGLLVADGERGLITPQFHHLYPTWLAVFRSWGGDRAMLYVSPLFGVLSVLTLLAICRRFLPMGAAFAAAVLLALNLTQIWQARFSTAEITAQLCILTMLYLLLLYFESGSIAAALLAALALDMAVQARYDSLLLVPLLALLVYARNLTRWQRRDWVLVAGGAAAMAHVVLHSTFISFLYRPGLDLFTRYPAFWAALAGGVLAVLVVAFVAFRRWPDALSRLCTGRAVRIAAIVLIIVAAFFAYTVRPDLSGGDEQDRQNFVALGSFMTPLGLTLAAAGACLLVWRARTSGELALLVVGIVLIAVYVRAAHIEHFYMWRARRFVPIVVPMLCLFAAYGLSVLAVPLARWRSAACGVIAMALVAVPMAKHWSLVTTRDNHGALDFVARVARDLDPDAVYICNGYWLAMPLRMLYGFETYAVSDPTPAKCRAALDFAKRTLPQMMWYRCLAPFPEGEYPGRAVYFIDQDRPHIFPWLACMPVEGGRHVFVSERLERRAGLPQSSERVEFQAVVNALRQAAWAPQVEADTDLTWEFEPDWFHVGQGFARKDIKRITFVETAGGERVDPTPDTPPDEIRYGYAWLTGRESALWIPYDPAHSFTAELRISTSGIEHGVEVVLGQRTLATIEPGESFHTVVVSTSQDLLPVHGMGRALFEFVSLAPPEYKGPRGVYIDRLRLRSVDDSGAPVAP